MNTSRLTIAVQELEQALAALDETMQMAAQKMQDRSDNTAGTAAETNASPDGREQVREELVAVRKMVRDAAELVALARAADIPPEQGQGSDHPEMH